MIPKALESIVESDVNELIASKVGEKRTIDYKEQLNTGRDEEKKEFLADVSSFANSAGGDLIFGVSEDKGLPTGAPGLTVADTDAEGLRLEEIIRNGVQPRMTGVAVRWVDMSAGNKVLIIRVPRSWNSPHRVTFRGHDKFYARNSAGKYPLDVIELRAAFNLSGELSSKIEGFRTDRIAAINANATPRPFMKGAKLIMHFIPLASFGPEQVVDLKQVFDLNPMPMWVRSWTPKYNFDGVITYDDHEDRETSESTCHSYAQFYRNGVIEAVEGRILSPHYTDKDKKYIPYAELERELTKYTEYCIECLKNLSVAPPIYAFITLTGVKGYEMPPEPGKWRTFRFEEPQKVDRDILMLPELIIEDYSVNVHDKLAMPIDTIWNACGYERSKTYNSAGKK